MSKLNKGKKGWFGDSYGHSLAARGITSGSALPKKSLTRAQMEYFEKKSRLENAVVLESIKDYNKLQLKRWHLLRKQFKSAPSPEVKKIDKKMKNIRIFVKGLGYDFEKLSDYEMKGRSTRASTRRQE